MTVGSGDAEGRSGTAQRACAGTIRSASQNPWRCAHVLMSLFLRVIPEEGQALTIACVQSRVLPRFSRRPCRRLDESAMVWMARGMGGSGLAVGRSVLETLA